MIETKELRRMPDKRGHMVLLAKCRHYHEPTVEDLLVDMHRELNEVSASYAVDSDELEDKFSHIIAEFAAKLQLRGDEQ